MGQDRKKQIQRRTFFVSAFALVPHISLDRYVSGNRRIGRCLRLFVQLEDVRILKPVDEELGFDVGPQLRQEGVKVLARAVRIVQVAVTIVVALGSMW